jgi:hypothetical protein
MNSHSRASPGIIVRRTQGFGPSYVPFINHIADYLQDKQDQPNSHEAYPTVYPKVLLPGVCLVNQLGIELIVEQRIFGIYYCVLGQWGLYVVEYET